MYNLRVIRPYYEENLELGEGYKVVNLLNTNTGKEIVNRRDEDCVAFLEELWHKYPNAPMHVVGDNGVDVPLYPEDVAYIVRNDGTTYSKLHIPACEVTSPEDVTMIERMEKESKNL